MGGSRGSAPPPPPPPAPPPAAPKAPTTRDAGVDRAMSDTRAQRRVQGRAATVLAGETMGSPRTGRKALLGE
jgi:hypothetical protein